MIRLRIKRWNGKNSGLEFLFYSAYCILYVFFFLKALWQLVSVGEIADRNILRDCEKNFEYLILL